LKTGRNRKRKAVFVTKLIKDLETAKSNKHHDYSKYDFFYHRGDFHRFASTKLCRRKWRNLQLIVAAHVAKTELGQSVELLVRDATEITQ